MTQTVTLELPTAVVERARAVAERTRRPMEEVLVGWLSSRIGEEPVEDLPDDAVLALCDDQMPDAEQEQLSDLLARQREGHLQSGDNERLQGLLQGYRKGLILKARAWRTAVARGLRPPLS
jgi:hypothetical protein